MFKLCARQINPSTSYKEIIKNEMRCRDDMPKQYNEDAVTGLCVITFTFVFSLVTFLACRPYITGSSCSVLKELALGSV